MTSQASLDPYDVANLSWYIWHDITNLFWYIGSHKPLLIHRKSQTSFDPFGITNLSFHLWRQITLLSLMTSQTSLDTYDVTNHSCNLWRHKPLLISEAVWFQLSHSFFLKFTFTQNQLWLFFPLGTKLNSSLFGVKDWVCTKFI